MMNSPVYEEKYAACADQMPFLVSAMADNAGSTVNSVAHVSGEFGVQALFDAVMDAGHRMVLVNALNSPSLNGAVREKLEVFLYGQRKLTPVLFSQLH